MFDLLWRMLRKNNVGPSGRVRLPKERSASARPQLEALEDRVMPSAALGVVPPIPAPAPPPAGITASTSSNNLQTLTNPPASSAQHLVEMLGSSSQSTINLDQVFAEQSGLQYEDGLQWSMLGNTNAALVKTDLSEAELTLQATPGQSGVATITVGATDADGVSEQESILVLVQPSTQIGVANAPQAAAGATASQTTVPAV